MKHLVIQATLPDGHVPESYFRSQNVGVGGGYDFGPFRGGPVRRATLSEIRHLDRCAVLRMLARFPNATITFARV